MSKTALEKPIRVYGRRTKAATTELKDTANEKREVDPFDLVLHNLPSQSCKRKQVTDSQDSGLGVSPTEMDTFEFTDTLASPPKPRPKKPKIEAVVASKQAAKGRSTAMSTLGLPSTASTETSPQSSKPNSHAPSPTASPCPSPQRAPKILRATHSPTGATGPIKRSLASLFGGGNSPKRANTSSRVSSPQPQPLPETKREPVPEKAAETVKPRRKSPEPKSPNATKTIKPRRKSPEPAFSASSPAVLSPKIDEGHRANDTKTVEVVTPPREEPTIEVKTKTRVQGQEEERDSQLNSPSPPSSQTSSIGGGGGGGLAALFGGGGGSMPVKPRVLAKNSTGGSKDGGPIRPQLKKSATWPRIMPVEKSKNDAKSKGKQGLENGGETKKGGSSMKMEHSSQEYFDDVQFLLDGLQPNKSTSIRCSSAVNLAERCTCQEFRMHLRAHSIIPRIVDAFADAHESSVLLLCAANVLRALGSDRLAAELTPTSLDKLAACLKVKDTQHDTKTVPSGPKPPTLVPRTMAVNFEDKTVRKIREQLLQQGSTCLDGAGQPSVCLMALQCLAGLTAQTGELSDRVRESTVLNGVARLLVDTVAYVAGRNGSVNGPDRDVAYVRLGHVFKVLEHVTFMSSANQSHLCTWEGGAPITALLNWMRYMSRQLERKQDGAVSARDVECVQSAMRVAVNLTNNGEVRDYVFANDLLPTLCSLSLCLPGAVAGVVGADTEMSQEECSQPSDTHHRSQRAIVYDLRVLGLGLLTNLLEKNPENRSLVAALPLPITGPCKGQTVLEAVVSLFATHNEPPTPDAPDSPTLERQTECNLIAAYSALVLAWLVTDCPTNQTALKEKLTPDRPHASIGELVEKLDDFLRFQALSGIATVSEGAESMQVALQSLKELLPAGDEKNSA